MLDKIKNLTDILIQIDEKLGFKKFVKYSFILGIGTILILNYKIIIRDFVEMITEISEDIHSEKMELRSQLLEELKPMLIEFRSDVKADRILYLEYHNSKENLIGIPFKYIELVLQASKYGIPPVKEEDFKNINAGTITDIYGDIKSGNIVYCNGSNDSIFKTRYPGMYNFLNSKDGSKKHVYISVPGIDQPVGIIILEWMNDIKPNNLQIEEITRTATQNYIPRINALILSKRKK